MWGPIEEVKKFYTEEGGPEMKKFFVTIFSLVALLAIAGIANAGGYTLTSLISAPQRSLGNMPFGQESINNNGFAAYARSFFDPIDSRQ